MSARTLQLPRLVAGRDFADDLVDALRLAPGAEVVVDAGELLSGTPSFAAELVERVLVAGQAGSMLLLDAPADFTDYICAAAHDLGVDGKLVVRRAAARSVG
ncbi:MAG TPA: hypothetical protein VFU36_06835 [Jatrophihabitans sp.]|nr:hypothetical protein [Jatrophihabitans sp.]